MLRGEGVFTKFKLHAFAVLILNFISLASCNYLNTEENSGNSAITNMDIANITAQFM